MFLFLYFTISTIVNNGTNFDVLEQSATSPAKVHLTTTRVLTIAFSFGFSIFVLVYAMASFR
jgi:hypothetical protein